MDGRLCRSRIRLQKFILTNLQKQILLDHAEKEKPNESCALLFGENNIVREIFITKNIAKSPISFTISNDELIRAYKTAEEKKYQVIGVFHSHPNSEPIPSTTDKKFMEINPVMWVIYSNINDEFRAYVLKSEIIELSILEKKYSG